MVARRSLPLLGSEVELTRLLSVGLSLMAKPVLFVVDDDEDTLQLIARDLERNYGRQYRILTTRTGREALKTLRRLRDRNEPAALVLAGLRLTDMTGVEFLREAHGLFPDAKR